MKFTRLLGYTSATAMSLTPIELVRAGFAQSVVATMATQVAAYLRLIQHPEVIFADFLEALDRGPVIADDAATRLHARFQLPIAGAPNVRRQFWEKVLRQYGIDPTSGFYGPQPVSHSTTDPVIP